jgi:hypothetical protein
MAAAQTAKLHAFNGYAAMTDQTLKFIVHGLLASILFAGLVVGLGALGAFIVHHLLT